MCYLKIRIPVTLEFQFSWTIAIPVSLNNAISLYMVTTSIAFLFVWQKSWKSVRSTEWMLSWSYILSDRFLLFALCACLCMCDWCCAMFFSIIPFLSPLLLTAEFLSADRNITSQNTDQSMFTSPRPSPEAVSHVLGRVSRCFGWVLTGKGFSVAWETSKSFGVHFLVKSVKTSLFLKKEKLLSCQNRAKALWLSRVTRITPLAQFIWRCDWERQTQQLTISACYIIDGGYVVDHPELGVRVNWFFRVYHSLAVRLGSNANWTLSCGD